MQSKLRTRIGSMLLVAVMLLSLLPVSALAAGEEPIAYTPWNQPIYASTKIFGQDAHTNALPISESFAAAVKSVLEEMKTTDDNIEVPSNAADLTVGQMQQITGKLDLRGKGITALPAARKSSVCCALWEGMKNITEIDFSGNTFTVVPYDFFGTNKGPDQEAAPEIPITKITWPDTVEVFADQSMDNMVNLVEMNIPTSLKVVKSGALSGCSNLQLDLSDFPEGVNFGSKSMRDVQLTGNFDAIQEEKGFTFYKTTYANDGVLNQEANAEFVFENTQVTATAEYLMENYSELVLDSTFGALPGVTGNLVLPQGAEAYNYCFDQWGITSAEIPSSVTLGTGCFSNNTELKTIVVKTDGTNIPDLSSSNIAAGVDVTYEMGTPSTDMDLQAVIDAAMDGDTIVLAPGDYNGNIHFAEKSLTIKGANAGIDPNTGVRGEETVFTGTMSTSYEPMCSTDPQHNKPYDSTFNADQKVIIDGITFSGDGLKVGDNNYNSVGDLTVTNCIFVPGNDLAGDTQHSTDGTTNRDWAQNMYNYFVKVSNDPEKGYFAKVTLTNNKIDGNTTSTVATYPVALWCVDDVTVNNNVFDFDTPALAINISKADDQAKIAVNNNKITNVTTAVYFSTWAVPAETFTGSVEIKNNQIVNATSEEVIFVGYDGEPHKEFAGSVNAVGNTLDSKPVDVVIGVKDEESSALVTATFKDGSTVIGSISGAPSGEANAFTFTLPAALTKANYTFIGWSNGENTFDAGDVVAITADTTFTARWSYNGGSSSGSGSSSSSGDYIVSVDKTTNGKITVSPSRADKGDTVTITVKPDAGYELDELIVTDKNGDTVKLTDKGNGKYTFTMPGSKVEITATFVEITEEQVDPFTDVTTSDYYYDAVLWAVENGVTNGTSATTFSPNMAVSRAQMVTFLWRAHGAPKATGTNPFTDVSTSDYYYDAVLWAVANGVTNGTSATTFSPDMAVTRAQAVTFQWRAAGSDTVSGSNFGDVAADAYYANAVTWAVANGITNGTGGDNFSPDVVVSRAQAVTFLYRELA